MKIKKLNTQGFSHDLLAIAFILIFALVGTAYLVNSHAATPVVTTSATFIASNCAPVAEAQNGTMVWYSRNSAGVWDVYVGNDRCQGKPLLPAYDGNRGPADITPDGRYVLLTTAVGSNKTGSLSSPGEGSGNAIQLYDRQTGKLSTLLRGATTSQRGLIWPHFNANDTKIVWSQMLQTGTQAGDVGSGRWALHVADVNLAAGTLSNNVSYQLPSGQPTFYEAYGWIPNTNLLIFMSTGNHSSASFRNAQMYTLPDSLNPQSTPTRISPEITAKGPLRTTTQNTWNEFAHFVPGYPNIMYTSTAAGILGDDLFAYNLSTQGSNGLLAQPTRVSYFNGLGIGFGRKAVSGWPKPKYTVVTTMAWDNTGWVTATCPDLLCSKVNAYRINVNPANP